MQRYTILVEIDPMTLVHLHLWPQDSRAQLGRATSGIGSEGRVDMFGTVELKCSTVLFQWS